MVVEKAVKGMTANLMIKWLDEVLLPESPHLKYLILDRTSAHTAQIIKEFAAKKKLELLYLPAKTAPSLSPLDNRFFAQFKSKFYGHDLSNSIKKKAAAKEIYEDILPETVQKYFSNVILYIFKIMLKVIQTVVY